MHLDQRRIRTFRGSPAEIVYQHQHAQLPLEQLEGVPQPIVALVMMLLEKDPLRRFQTPAELLRVIPTITDAIKSSQTVTYQSLRKMPAGDSYAVLHKPQAKLGPEKISIARLPTTGTDIFDREQDIAFLNDAWANQIVNVVTIVAWTRVGKSALVNEWLRRMAAEHYRSAQLVFGWSFRHGQRLLSIHLQMNFFTLLWLGLEIQIHGLLKRRVRRARDWRGLLRIVEPYWFWMAWTCSNTRMVHKRGGYVSLPCRGSLATSRPPIGGFA